MLRWSLLSLSLLLPACADKGDSSDPGTVGTTPDTNPTTETTETNTTDTSTKTTDTSTKTTDTSTTTEPADDRTESGFSWCAAGGLSQDGTYTHAGCLSPVDLAAGGTATDGTYTLQAGPFVRLAP